MPVIICGSAEDVIELKKPDDYNARRVDMERLVV